MQAKQVSSSLHHVYDTLLERKLLIFEGLQGCLGIHLRHPCHPACMSSTVLLRQVRLRTRGCSHTSWRNGHKAVRHCRGTRRVNVEILFGDQASRAVYENHFTLSRVMLSSALCMHSVRQCESYTRCTAVTHTASNQALTRLLSICHI